MNCYLRCVPLITIALILLSACGSENKKSSINIGHEPFGKGILLDKTIHNSIGDLVIAPSGLYVTDSMTIIIDEYANNNIVSFFDSKTLELITSFGSRGEGPKEFSDSPLILQPDLANKDILELYDWGKKRLVRISLSALLKKDEIEILYETRIPPKVLDAQQVGKINNNLVASGTLSEGLVAFIDDSSFNISYLDFEPFSISKDLNISDRKWFLNMWMAINSDHEKIVLVAERFNHLLIYDFNGELLESIKLDN
ncbi:MAG TPA: hypothetical protein DHV30_07845, partial [Balneola sp.]|nr:hypothetical protein [Balneola sp.]